MERDSPSVTKNAYLLCLNRRYIIHFQYSVSGFGILELTKSANEFYQRWWAKRGPFFSYSELIESARAFEFAAACLFFYI